jgi:hypothetical protein
MPKKSVSSRRHPLAAAEARLAKIVEAAERFPLPKIPLRGERERPGKTLPRGFI